MSLDQSVLTQTDNFPLRSSERYDGKVRSVYWLYPEDSARLITSRRYTISPPADLGVMITSDRLSASDVIWNSVNLSGVPGKGAALNAISSYWFRKLQEANIGQNHIVEVPHPLVWIVQRAQPLKIEGIARQYMGGSLWREYRDEAERDPPSSTIALPTFGVNLPRGLQEHDQLASLLITPTTKGTICGIPGLPEAEDANINPKLLLDYWEEFGFRDQSNIFVYQSLLMDSFTLMQKELADEGYLLFDTKVELGYVPDGHGRPVMIFIDEMGTPDSSRFVSAQPYEARRRVEEMSKEPFRRFLRDTHGPWTFSKNAPMEARRQLAETYQVPTVEFLKVADIYRTMAEVITHQDVPAVERPREEIMAVLGEYDLLQ